MRVVAGFMSIIVSGLLSVVGYVMLEKIMNQGSALFIVGTCGPLFMMWCFILISKHNYDEK